METPEKTQQSAQKATTREELMALGQEINARLGIVGGPMTPEEIRNAINELHVSMIAHGIKPEDKGASRELLRMRYGDNYDQDNDHLDAG